MPSDSGTPLVTKLGLRGGQRACFVNPPQGYVAALELPAGLTLLARPSRPLDFAQVFATQRDELEAQLKRLLPLLDPDGMLWVSWPKQAMARKLGIATDVTEDVVRELALPLGLVDIKVCAVDETWSGLKLVIRREMRETPVR